jgi:SH3 domain-containing YSC84-like protein 1
MMMFPLNNDGFDNHFSNIGHDRHPRRNALRSQFPRSAKQLQQTDVVISAHPALNLPAVLPDVRTSRIASGDSSFKAHQMHIMRSTSACKILRAILGLVPSALLLAATTTARGQYPQQPAPVQYAQPAPVQYAQPYPAATPEVATVDAAVQVLNEIMAAPARSIPRALLHDAQAIVIAPGLIKGGFIIGARYGHGVLVMRNEQGVWRAPSFITIAGGSIGWQLGVQSTDVILVFKTRHGVQDLINGKLTIGGDVSAAAGPVGREASASTDMQLRAEIYSYSRSRGLFAGAALDGTVVSMDNAATAAYYRGTGILWADAPPGHPAALPPSAGTLLATIAAYADGQQPAAVAAAPVAAGAVPAVVAPIPGQPAGAPATVPAPGAPVAANVPAGTPPPGAAPTVAGLAPIAATVPAAAGPPAIAMNTLPSDMADIRSRLVNASQRMNSRVDPRWQSYLALPPEIMNPNATVRPEALEAAVKRYKAVATDPKYKVLAQRPEFQETFGLLKAYRDLQSVSTVPGATSLPAPP